MGPFSPAPMFDIMDSILGSMKKRKSSTTPEAITHKNTGYASAEIIVRRSWRRASMYDIMFSNTNPRFAVDSPASTRCVMHGSKRAGYLLSASASVRPSLSSL